MKAVIINAVLCVGTGVALVLFIYILARVVTWAICRSISLSFLTIRSLWA